MLLSGRTKLPTSVNCKVACKVDVIVACSLGKHYPPRVTFMSRLLRPNVSTLTCAWICAGMYHTYQCQTGVHRTAFRIHTGSGVHCICLMQRNIKKNWHGITNAYGRQTCITFRHNLARVQSMRANCHGKLPARLHASPAQQAGKA